MVTPTDSPARVPRVDAAGRVRLVPTPAGWRGVRVSTQAEADTRIPLLLDEPAAVRFVWVEPVEAVDLSAVTHTVQPGYFGEAGGSRARVSGTEEL